jgi:uncharacterized membrane protein
MVIAARTASQIATHMGIAFSVMYCLTGSIAFGGLAALLEPVINVMLLPVHERLWKKIHRHWERRIAAIAAQKASQAVMHMAVAFAVMYYATGSAVFGGLAAILEPICNVALLPFHERMWDKAQMAMRPIPA